MIHIEGLQKHFGAVTAVDGVDFDVPDGQVTGLLGPNGAGKTTTLRMLYGLMRCDRGHMEVDGVDVMRDPQGAQARMGILPDSRGLYPRLTAREHLRYIHLSESDRGTPGAGTIAWDEIYSALRAIGFKGGLAMESFINMPPEIAVGLSVWRPVASGEAEVMEQGLPFLRHKARQYGLIS